MNLNKLILRRRPKRLVPLLVQAARRILSFPCIRQDAQQLAGCTNLKSWASQVRYSARPGSAGSFEDRRFETRAGTSCSCSLCLVHSFGSAAGGVNVNDFSEYADYDRSRASPLPRCKRVAGGSRHTVPRRPVVEAPEMERVVGWPRSIEGLIRSIK